MREGRRKSARGGAFAAGVRRRRLAAASVAIACLVAAVAVSGAVQRASPFDASSGASSAHRRAGFAAVMGASGDAAYAVEPGIAEAAFSGELPSFSGEEDVLLDEATSIVAYLTEGTAASAATELAARMEPCGWARVESGSETFETFRKEGGAYRWAFASYAEIGERVRVTIQCA